MTVPFEQLMALKMGRQALTIIVDDDMLNAVARGTAQWLLHLYPSEEQLDAGVIAETDSLPQCAAVLSATASGHTALRSAWSTFPDYASTRIGVRSVARDGVSALTREQVRLRRLERQW